MCSTTTKPSLGIICGGVSVNLQACANILEQKNIPLPVQIPIPIPNPACCQSLGQIEDLTTSIGINRTCVCAQAAVAEVVPEGIRVGISNRILAACVVNIPFNITGLPGQCDA